MRRFYEVFPKRDALRPELSWTHYRVLLRVENPQAREWYMAESAGQHWSSWALERQIGTLYYERLLSSQDRTAVQQEAENQTRPLSEEDARNYLRAPYVLDFLNLPGERYLEADLERGLIDNLQAFLLELGKGFAFVARQQRISTDDQDFYIDLVFYNFKLKCFLLVDLKLDKLTRTIARLRRGSGAHTADRNAALVIRKRAIRLILPVFLSVWFLMFGFSFGYFKY